jgi:hypothetical protein
MIFQIDLLFGIQPKNRHCQHCQYIFEFKYLKKENQSDLKNANEEAKN